MPNLYYTPPTDKQFNEVKERAVEIWPTMGAEKLPKEIRWAIRERMLDGENLSEYIRF